MERRDPELEEQLLQTLNGVRFGHPCYAFRQVGSTMDVAKQLAAQGEPEGTLVFAARQTQGRGRLGRRWESPAGGAYFSLILRPSRPPAEAPQLSLVAGLATAETIHEAIMGAGPATEAGTPRRGSPTGVPDAAGDGPPASPALPSVSIRWPNDILIDGKKVAGILTEGSSVRDSRATNHEPRSYVVLGIGINVTTDPKDLSETATSLQAALASSHDSRSTIHDPLDPLALASALCSKLNGWYDIWTAQGFAPIRESLRPWLHLGGLVRLTTGDSKVEGQATDVDEHGRLLVRLESGVTRAFDDGEVILLQ